MSLLDIVSQKYEPSVRTAPAAKTALGPLKAVRAVKAVQPSRENSQDREPSVQSVDMLRRKLLRERHGELRRAAGVYWEEFAVPAKVIGFTDSLATEQIREGGIVPDHYSATTECKRCGPVPIFEGCPPQVMGCPWCINGLTAPPIPSR